MLWAATWLPGLALASWRCARLLQVRRTVRALVEVAAIGSIPLLAFGFYAVSESQRIAQARGAPASLAADVWPVAHVLAPYAVSAAYLLVASRRVAGAALPARWWIALLVGLAAVPLIAPSLFLAQLMVFFGA